ncbi:MAG: cytochrome c biogenesis protein CcsA [Syntrophomonadaceae bacterium]|nr:cytochrome c biogenesis protein CcsA [Syntrophomonadaceae bacterium]
MLRALLYLTLMLYAGGGMLYSAGAKTGKANVLKAAFWLAALGGAGNLSVLVSRTVITGRLPLASGYEFLLSLTCLTVLIYLGYELKNGEKRAGGIIMLMAALLILFAVITAGNQLSVVSPLMPALKSPWLSVHVLTAVAAYAGFTLAAGLAVMEVLGKGRGQLNLSIYRMVAGGFAMLTVSIVFGAVWAEQAWGSYWSWDPKETWALVTWIIYALYLHLYNKRGLIGENASIVVIVGLVLVLFSFFGVNFLMSGLHSYAGVPPAGRVLG